MISKNTARWRVPSSLRLYWYSWHNEAVVYNSAWGSTHVLDLIAAETLKSIEREVATLPKLARLVAESLKIDSDTELRSYLKQLLPKLEELGLVERIQT